MAEGGVLCSCAGHDGVACATKKSSRIILGGSRMAKGASHSNGKIGLLTTKRIAIPNLYYLVFMQRNLVWASHTPVKAYQLGTVLVGENCKITMKLNNRF